MSRPASVLSACLALLRRRTVTALASPTRQVPGVRQLCREAGACQATVLRALGILKSEGVLQTRPGRGTFAVAPGGAVQPSSDPVSLPPAPPSLCKWRRVADALRRDIADEKLDKAAPLPAAKSLERQYGANYRTMRKALGCLYAEGHLSLAKGRYRVTGPSSVRAGSKVALVMRADLPRTFGSLGPRGTELFREIETHCSSRRIGIVHIICDYTGGDMHITPGIAAAASAHGDTLLGVIFWVAGFTRDQVATILKQLDCLSLPIAVLDEQDVVRQLEGRLPRTMRVTTMGVGRECGLEVGRYLVRNGHRRVAYLDFEPLVPWSAERLGGLRAAFSECGVRDVPECVTVGPEIPPELVSAPFSVDQLTLSARCRYSPEEILRALRRVENVVWSALRDERRSAQLQGAVGRLLRHSGVSAWVASCDSLAIACMGLLAQRRVKVPQKLSVVGFDDIPESLYWGLTSYSFNPRGVAARLVDIAVSSPAVLRRGQSAAPGAVPGHISERSSCGAPER